MNTNKRINYAFYTAVMAILLLLFAVYFSSVDIENLQAVNAGFQTKLNEQALKIKKLENKVNALQKRIDEFSKVTVKATAYNAISEQTDSTPNETSCGVIPRVGSIAVSQDLFYKGWTCGKWVRIKHLGIFEITQILDVMHYRKTSQIDIVKATEEEANEFGVVTGLNAVLLSNYEKM